MLSGKGMFIWRVRGCEDGVVSAIANLAVQSGLKHILLKVADGNFTYNIDTKTGADLAAPLVHELRGRGIQVYGWQYVYGYDPLKEADIAIKRVQQLNLDGFVIDAEREYKQPGRDRDARAYMLRLRGGLPSTVPVGLSSYRYPSLHPQVPWKEFLLRCDFNMPQVYWLASYNPGDQLKRCVQEFQRLTPYRPIIPTGVAFKYGTWAPTVQQITEFMQTAQSLNMPAVNYWEWSRCRKYLPEIWELIKAYPWPGSSLVADITQDYTTALNEHNPDEVLELYHADAVHVTNDHALRGSAAIRTWFQTLFSQLLPEGRYILDSFSGTGSVRHMTWTASSSKGDVHNGNDTIGMVDGKISYHYSDFLIN